MFRKKKPGLDVRIQLAKANELTDEEKANSVYVGVPLTKMAEPVTPSTKRYCVKCEAAVWIDNNTLELADESSEIMCLDCVMVELEDKIGTGK